MDESPLRAALQRLWQILTDAEIGWKVYAFGTLLLIALAMLAISDQRGDCNERCVAAGHERGIYAPAGRYGIREASCKCVEKRD